MSKYGVKLSTLALAGLSIFAVNANASENHAANGANVHVGGLVQLDSGFHMSDTATGADPATGGDPDILRKNLKNGTELRRAKLNASGDAGDWSFRVGVEHKEKYNVWSIWLDDAYLAYNGLADNVSISMGYMCPIFGYENSLSNSNYNFLEASASGQTYGTSAEKGISVTGGTDSFMAGASVFFPAKRDADLDPGASSEWLWGASARFTFSPMHEAGRAYHVGVSGLYTNHNAKAAVKNGESDVANSFQMGPDNFGARGFKSFGLKYPSNAAVTGANKDGGLSALGVSAATAFNVDTVWYVGVDAATVMNSLSAWGEVVYSSINNKAVKGSTAAAGIFKADNHKSEDKWLAFTGELAYVVTGESRDYNMANGTIDGLKPAGNMGAFEVAARVSYLDMGGDNLKLGSRVGSNNGTSAFQTMYSGSSLVSDKIGTSAWSMWNVGVAGTWYANEFASVKANLNLQRLPNAITEQVYASTDKDKNLINFGLRAQLAW